jgi:3-oxoacyl-[acyl-carrier-protein] synthase II
MKVEKSEVWVTGIGLVSSLGECLQAHWEQLASGRIPSPSVDSENQAPYPVHLMVEYDAAKQIPNRGDQRQMGPWQRLGTIPPG